MCNIYEHNTAWKQFGLDSTMWELQEDNDIKHMWKVAMNWKKVIESINLIVCVCHLILHLPKMFDNLSIFDFRNKAGLEVFGSGVGYYTST